MDGDHFHATLISPAHHTFLHTLLHWAPRTDFSHRTCACLFFSIHFFSFHNDVIQTILTLSTNKCQQLVNIYLQSRHLCWTLGSDTSVYSALPLEDLRDIQTRYLNVIFEAYSVFSTLGSDTLTAAVALAKIWEVFLNHPLIENKFNLWVSSVCSTFTVQLQLECFLLFLFPERTEHKRLLPIYCRSLGVAFCISLLSTHWLQWLSDGHRHIRKGFAGGVLTLTHFSKCLFGDCTARSTVIISKHCPHWVCFAH